tara:strand:- start:412 stop:660 length:249 start_codon:yes stop_codon:yes gene_type:complete
MNKKLLEVMAAESITCIKRGDIDDAQELYFLILDNIQEQLKPSLKDPYFLAKLIKDSNSDNETRSTQAMMLLSYFKSRNLLP